MTAPNGSNQTAGQPLLEVGNITAYYSDLQALFDISLQVNAGEIVTLIGANGAGKTTILRVISGMKQRPAALCVLPARMFPVSLRMRWLNAA